MATGLKEQYFILKKKNIHEEFNGDFQKDKFKEFFDRVIADIDMEGLCGNYEAETAEMLKKSFQNANIQM